MECERERLMAEVSTSSARAKEYEQLADRIGAESALQLDAARRQIFILEGHLKFRSNYSLSC